MPPRKSWVWKYFAKTSEDNFAKCNLCDFKTTVVYLMKLHLDENYKIFNKTEEKRWLERVEKDQSIWKHFTKQSGYSAKCNICSQFTIKYAHKFSNLKRHMIRVYREKLTEEQQEPLDGPSTSTYPAETSRHVAENVEAQDFIRPRCDEIELDSYPDNLVPAFITEEDESRAELSRYLHNLCPEVETENMETELKY